MTEEWHDWRDRLDQANERLNEVEAIIKEFVAQDPYGVIRKINHKSATEAVFTATMTAQKPIPRKVSLLLAETFGHLRSGLDHMMCALATPMGMSDAPSGTQFPVFKDRKVFKALDKTGKPKKGGGLYQMRSAPVRVQAMIQSLQPYKRGGEATSDPLWMLHDFANIDKHRKPHLTGAILQGASAGIRNMWGVTLHIEHLGVRTGAFTAGTEIARMNFTITAPADYMVDMDVDVTYDVAFDPKGPSAGGLVVPTMRGIIDRVRDVIAKLEPLI